MTIKGKKWKSQEENFLEMKSFSFKPIPIQFQIMIYTLKQTSKELKLHNKYYISASAFM